MTASSRRPESQHLLDDALASDDPLGAIMDRIDTGREPGRSFNLAHGFRLEVYSATMSILFDRFEDDELDDMEDALALIGATATLAEWRSVRAAFDALVADGADRFDASETLDASPAAKPVLRRFAEQAAEVEGKLVEFARANWPDLVRA